MATTAQIKTNKYISQTKKKKENISLNYYRFYFRDIFIYRRLEDRPNKYSIYAQIQQKDSRTNQ